MTKFLFHKVLHAAITILIALIILFVLIQQNSDIFLSSVMGLEANDELRIVTATMYQMNAPIEVKFVQWFQKILTGKVFFSNIYGGFVLSHLVKSMGTSMSYMLIGLALALLLTITLSIISVRYQHKGLIGFLKMFGLFGISMHELTFCVFFVVILRRSMFGLAFLREGEPLFSSGIMNFLVGALIPVSFLALRMLGVSLRYIQSEMLTVAKQDFVTAERSRGKSNLKLYFGSILKNCHVAIVPSIGMMLMEASGCMIIIESFLRIPGFFRGFYMATLSQDINQMTSYVFFAILCVVTLNLFLDWLLALSDPRISYQ